MILVTGATGNVGRPLLDALLAAGTQVRAVTRDPFTARLPEGVEVVAAGGDRTDDYAEYFDGVSAVFLNSAAVRGPLTDFARLARERGVRRLVGLSAFNIGQPRALQPSRFFGHRNAETEAAVEGSGLEWTSLRPASYFGPIHLALWRPQLAAGDVISGAPADFAEPIIDPRDVGEVAARALLTDELLGRKPVLTGPRAVSQAEQVAILATALDRPLEFRELGLEAAAEAIEASGLPAAMVASLIARFAAYRDAPPQPAVTGEVAKILGRPARGFEEWAFDNAAAFG